MGDRQYMIFDDFEGEVSLNGCNYNLYACTIFFSLVLKALYFTRLSSLKQYAYRQFV